MKQRLNKRGEIPIVVLVIGIFAICSFALVSFFISDISTKNSFVGLDTMQKMNIQIENSSFYNLPKKEFYLAENVSEREHWYSLDKTEKILFSVRYVPS